MQASLRAGSVELYNDLAPENPIDTILARVIVGLTNVTMQCFDRIPLCKNDAARDINLRNGNKCVERLVDIIGLYENRKRIRKLNAEFNNRSQEVRNKTTTECLWSKLVRGNQQFTCASRRRSDLQFHPILDFINGG